MNNEAQSLTELAAVQAGGDAPLSNRRDWQFHAERINAAWRKQTASIIETGKYLIEAHDEMERTSFEAMVQQKLTFGPSTARKLIVIARHPILTNCAHVHKWPPSWGTLYELAKLPIEVLRAKLADGRIAPKLERKDVVSWRKGENSKIKVDGQTVERKPPLAEQLKIAKTKIATLEAKLKSAGGSLFDLKLDSAEEIGKALADNMSEGRFDAAVKAAKARYKAKRQRPAG
jgi:hypothetical protein